MKTSGGGIVKQAQCRLLSDKEIMGQGARPPR